MNGAQALIRTLVDCGVDVCFTNPGTSEMHFVAALDAVPEMRGVLGLFEGVVTGAADGYGRMADRPAATLLHLGPGLGNGLANLHNARRARTPVVNIVGDHATYHTRYDAQLQSDIETVARNVSSWVRTSQSPQKVAGDAVEAIRAAVGPPGQVATLILPADVSWEDGAEPAVRAESPAPSPASVEAVEEAAKAICSGKRTAMLLGQRIGFVRLDAADHLRDAAPNRRSAGLTLFRQFARAQFCGPQRSASTLLDDEAGRLLNLAVFRHVVVYSE